MLERNKIYDIIRALCMLEIVCLWHLNDYPVLEIHLPAVFGRITDGCLACFFLLSGVLNSSKKRSAIDFYKKRITRLYIPYVAALLVAYLVPMPQSVPSIMSLLYAILGMSCFVGPMPYTLWFVCVLLIFYLITPVYTTLSKCKHGMIYEICILVLIEAVFFVLYYFALLDLRIILYWPFYATGLIMSRSKFEYWIGNKWFMFILIGLSVPLFFSFYHVGLIGRPFVNLCVLNWIVLVALVMDKFLSKSRIFDKIISWVSYSSMFCYLFHRPIYSFFLDVFPVHGIYIVPIMIVIVLIVGYFLQRGYDMLLNKISQCFK